ncbi:MAG: phosphate ABC transporter substrate-binding protein [Algisphaera sp.]
MNVWRLGWLGVLLATLVGCGEASGVHVVLTGSSTMAPLVQAAAQRYELEHLEVRIDVQTGGSSRGIADVAKGLSEVGMTSRALKEQEKAGLTQHVLARDGVAFVVHESNGVEGLTREQAKAIFVGTVTNWREVGGADAPIVVVNRPEGRSELDLVSVFWGVKPSALKADVIGGENQQAVKLVVGNPNAIVYLSMGTAAYEKSAGTPIKLLNLDGVAASVKTLLDGTYPLGRPLVLVTGGKTGAAARDFLDYLLSSEVDGLIEEGSFVVPQR